MNRIAIGTAALVAATTVAGPALAADAAAIAPHVWSARITGASPAVLNGTWRLSIKGGTFAVAKGTALAVGGTVRIAGSRVTFRDLGGPFACRGAQATGVYRWRVNGKRLTMAAVSERCAGRKTILTRPFTRVL
ncbi:MAG TPA: hypothetical protein VFA24_01845 [Gaiellaceae bacterium]|nr:hypothetical protein [Gaiellaceae bacterium]